MICRQKLSSRQLESTRCPDCTQVPLTGMKWLSPCCKKKKDNDTDNGKDKDKDKDNNSDNDNMMMIMITIVIITIIILRNY